MRRKARLSGLLTALLLLAACANAPDQPATDTAELVVPAAEENSPDVNASNTPLPEIPVEEATPEPEGDLWSRIRSGFTLGEHEHPRIQSQLRWYADHQSYLDRVATRATPYLHLIVEEIEKRDMPMEIALLPIVESAFDPFAYSHGRAAGLWQFIPGTGQRFGLKQNWWYDGRRDVAESTRAALDYLEYLHRHFDGDWLLALAAYNSGEGNVGRAVRYNERRGRPTDFFSLNLPRETEAYVPKLLALQKLAKMPSEFGVALKSIPDEPFLESVELDQQIDIALAAKLAGMEVEEVYLLNPGFNRWATDPDGPHSLLLPRDKSQQFREALAEMGDRKTVEWRRHLVRSGENLGQIANHYKTTISLLKEVNNIRGNMIRAGKYLTVPVAMRSLEEYELSAQNRTETKQNRARDGVKVSHRVVAGESFWSISRRYEVAVRELAAWNNMAPGDPLRAGETLVVWTDNPPPMTQVGLSPGVRVRNVTYTVRRGDSLARIAGKFGVTVNQIAAWNDLELDNYLQPGQRLRLRVDVTKQST